MFDIIGDIHGHADKLEELLKKLGYSNNSGVYSHPERKVLFVGDYIDRGPKIKETLRIIKQMVDDKQAIALMGNHEYNAICFHFQESEGGHLRKHKIKNILQHYETLRQFQNLQSEYENYIEWFKTLPLFYENDNFRAVHACWNNKYIDYLRVHLTNDKLTDDIIYQSVKKGSLLHDAIEITLNGKEIKMPNEHAFVDKDGNMCSEIRIKWWEDPSLASYKSISILPLEKLPDSPVDHSQFNNVVYYQEIEKPVFFGHYCLNGNPVLFRNNICCLDYSVTKNGYLVAYRFSGEIKLESDRIIFV